MQPEVTVAIIAATASFVAAVLSALMTSRNARKAAAENRQLAERQRELDVNLLRLRSDLEHEAKREERAHTARTELDLNRDPLLRAALDLARRLDNIRVDDFLAYLRADPRRSDMARLSTLYRCARYWCVVENLYDNVALLRFEQDEVTRPVATKLMEIAGTFASDEYDDRFMMWREEQRAVAELMRSDQPGGYIGYATFVDRLETFQPWFASFDDGLQSDTARGRERLRTLQQHLAHLVIRLDTPGTYRENCDALVARAEVGGEHPSSGSQAETEPRSQPSPA